MRTATQTSAPEQSRRTATPARAPAPAPQAPVAAVHTEAPVDARFGIDFGRMRISRSAISSVGAPDDPYEREADRVAAQVADSPSVDHGPASSGSAPPQVQAKGEPGQDVSLSPPLAAPISQMRGGGQPLPDSERDFFEQRFGVDFSRVRVHNDVGAAESARALGANAYTVGTDVVFGRGQYRPGTQDGRRLLAHELVHVVQQGHGQALPAQLQRRMAPLVGNDAVQQARVHTGPEARQRAEEADAHAVTEGRDIYFGDGEYRPGTPEGDRLIAHEVVHVAQGARGELRRPAAKAKGGRGNGGAAKSGVSTDTTEPLFTADEVPAEGSAEGTEPPARVEGETRSAASVPIRQEAPQSGARPADPAGAGDPDARMVARGRSEVGTELPSAVGAAAPSAAGGGCGGFEDLGLGVPGAPSVTPSTPELDTSSAGGLLSSLGATPASSFGKAVAMARDVAGGIASCESAAVEAGLPEVEQPTGLPAKPAKNNAPRTELPSAEAPAPLPPLGDRAAPPPTTAVAPPITPVPGSQLSTAATEPASSADDSGEGWWSWLTNRVKHFIASVPTRDPGLSTSAGPRSSVDLTRDADPAQNARYQQDCGQKVAAQQGQGDAAANADFGEGNIRPTLPTERLRASRGLSASGVARGGGPAEDAPALPADALAQLDAAATPTLAAQVGEQSARRRADELEFAKKSQEAREEGQRQLDKEDGAARREQEMAQQQARRDVQEGRRQWREENRKIREDYETQSETKRSEIDRQIGEKAQATDKEADQKLTEAEGKAEIEKARAEAAAADKKREAENQPRSFWASVKGAVSSAFDAIRSAVRGIFDALRETVRVLISAAKAAVRVLIEAARVVIVGLIRGFGDFCKGLVSIALAEFPEAVARARALIDGAVTSAEGVVNDVAEGLKRSAEAILDSIAAGIDLALSAMQKGFELILDACELFALAPLEAMDALARLIEKLTEYAPFLEGAEQVRSNPDAVINGLRDALGAHITEVPGRAYHALEAALSKAGAKVRKHLRGVGRHLEKGIAHLKQNWWAELKKLGWNLLWPWPAVWKDLKEIWQFVKLAWGSIAKLQISKAIDAQLKIAQLFNSILGNLYGWFFIASVLIGTIIGAFFGGAGAIPGAIAGAQFAGGVGEALLIGLAATEGAVITKSVVDLALDRNTPEEDEQDYSSIAGSVLTLAITGALVLVGALAAKLAKAVWEGAKSLFKGEAPEPGVPKVEGEAPKVEGEQPKVDGEAPKAEGSAEVIDGERVVGSEPTKDGHQVKVTEEGRCLICSTCQEIEIKYREELKGEGPELEGIKADLQAAKELPNGDAKAQAIERVKARLDKVRASARQGESLSTKLERLDSEAEASRAGLDEAKKSFREKKVSDLREDPAVRKELAKLEGELDELGREWQPLKKEAEGIKELASDPDVAELVATEADAIRGKFDDIRAKAESIKSTLKEKLKKLEEKIAAEAEVQRAMQEQAKAAQERIKNSCGDTDGTNRPNAGGLVDKTSETALREEIRTGKPYKCESGHYLKVQDAISTLKAKVKELTSLRSRIKDPDVIRSIDESIARATERIPKMEPAMAEWHQRGSTHPDVFNPDGTSKVYPPDKSFVWPDPNKVTGSPPASNSGTP